MTNSPYLMLKGRGGYRLGHDRLFDHMMLDGLEDAYQAGRSMGTFGEDCAAKYNFTREQQDAFAMASVQRAQDAIKNGGFAKEIAPVTVKTRAGEVVVSTDEGPGKIKIDKIPTLKPAFKKDGTITAAASSSINDGAAALALMHDLKVPHEKVNVNGGACALGHPIGASGARIMVTLIHALQARGLKKGLATLCIGGGEATAVALELL